MSLPFRSADPAHAAARHRARRVAALTALCAAAASGCATVAAAVAGDPVARFERRRGPLVYERSGPPELVDGHVVQMVHLEAAGGLAVDLLVKRPAVVRPVPLVLILGGHEAGRDAARLIPDTRGRAVAALSYPYRGAHRLSALGALRAAPAVRRAMLDTPPAVQLALDWLVEQPWVDAGQVEGVGASLGVPFMTAAAAVDPRIRRLWAVHGAGDGYRLLAHNARPFVRPRPLRAVAAGVAWLLVAGPALEPTRWVPRVAPRPFVMINATDDERLPRRAVLALWHAAREPKTLVWLPGRHVQRDRPEVVRALVATVIAMMDSLPLSRAVPGSSPRATPR